MGRMGIKSRVEGRDFRLRWCCVDEYGRMSMVLGRVQRLDT